MQLRLGFVCIMASLIPTAFTNANPAFIHDENGFEGAVRVVDRQQDDDGWTRLTVAIPYLDMRGEKREGEARVYFTTALLASGDTLPVYCAAHYPITEEKARELCGLGLVVVTGHYEKHTLELLIGDSYNLMKAMLQWVRRLPGIDRTRLLIGGGSAGGYMTLAMGAEFFPVSGLVPDLPAVNWAYGCNYLLANQEACGCRLPPEATRPLPVLALIAPGADLATALFGNDLSAPTWHTLSPISYVDRITAPVLVTCATGDMLCTIEQFTAKFVYPLDRDLFPENYERDFDNLTLVPQARKRLDEVVAPEALAVHVLKPSEGLHEYTLEDMKNFDDPLRCVRESPEVQLLWSKEKQWSMVILDEGPSLPHLGHTRYAWNVTPREFILAHRDLGIEQTEPNPAQFERLMERYAGRLSAVAILADGVPANRLNFQALERLDVVTGLLDYAELGPERVKQVKELYGVCPVRPLGPHMSVEGLRRIQSELRNETPAQEMPKEDASSQ